MFKRVISMLAALSMMCSIPTVFAEGENVSVTSNGTVSTENFTEDNIIYNAMNDMNRGSPCSSFARVPHFAHCFRPEYPQIRY